MSGRVDDDRLPAGTEPGASGDGVVARRVFLGIGAFVLVVGAIYWATAYEEGGVVMLVLAGALGLWIGTYLWLRTRASAAAATGEPSAPVADADGYEPHASVWPFAIGVGAATMANGLALGLWVFIPGVFVLAIGVGGFVRQTRRRD